jgi:DNA polymerase-4
VDGASTSPGLDVLHLDMDSFFAAVEVLHDPSLVGRPVIVGGTGGRGVVASASYEARVFGVHAAMPTAVARGLCPRAVFLPGRFDAYAQVSGDLHEILTSVTPIVEPVALDEAYLDVSGSHRLLGTSIAIAEQLRRRVHDELRLDCAVGVGRSKLIAKLASKAAKPTVTPAGVVAGGGVVMVPVDEELAFLHAHPVRAIPGIGPRTAEQLARFGVSSVADLAAVSRESLVRLLGASSGRALHELAWCRDVRPVVAEREARSIGHEETFAKDVRERVELARRAREIASRVAERLRSSGLEAKTVTLKVRFADFSSVTRARTLARPAATASVVGDTACELLDELERHDGVRLLGVHASSLVPAGEAPARQLELFASDPAGELAPEAPGRAGAPAARDVRDEVELAAEAIRHRFGRAAITSLGEQSRSGPRASPAGPVAPG